MEAHAYPKERIKGNVRIVLHEIATQRGTSYGVEVSVYSSFAGRWKLVSFTAGPDFVEATAMFNRLVGGIRGYCWRDDDYLLEEQ